MPTVAKAAKPAAKKATAAKKTTAAKATTAKKTTASKATAAKKTAAARAAKAGSVLDAKATPAAGEVGKAQTDSAGKLTADQILFHGRVLDILTPDQEQLGVWSRIIDRMNEAAEDPANVPGEEQLALYKRALKLIQSVLKHQVDRDWVEDSILEKKFRLAQAATIVQMAGERFLANARKNANKAAAPRTGPAPKARRRR